MSNQWHLKTIMEAIGQLRSSERGLNGAEAVRRLEEYGANKLPESKADSLFVIFLRQFQSPLIYILLSAGAVVLAMGEMVDGLIILAVLTFNAVIGTIQEGKTQNTILALKKMAETKAMVLREGQEFIINDTELVPGDIIILQEGERVPADARVIYSSNLKADEAAFTGESEPKHKIAETLEGEKVLAADQKNMVFKGTSIVAGNGRALVVATGIDTAIGKIASQVSAIDTEIPLKVNIRHLSRLIVLTVAVVSSVLLFLGMVKGNSLREMFLTVVSLAVSIIPEGLPVVVTLILVTGVWRMSKHNVLVKKIQAVESLGQASVIAVDKTGTVTKNELSIEKVYVNGNFFDVSGVGYQPSGEIRLNGNLIDAINHPELALIGRIGALCANARVMFSQEQEHWSIAGDPTEAAMVVFAQKIGLHRDELERERPILAEIPFDYHLKYHALVYSYEGDKYLAAAGAPEVILGLAKKVWSDGEAFILSSEVKKRLGMVIERMSQEGLRVLAVAESSDPPEVLSAEDGINNLTVIGFLGIKDTLRPEVPAAMAKAAAAGIRVIMITGDHQITAEAIAKEAGIYREGDHILVGTEIDMLSAEELSQRLIGVSVFARVTPEHKLKIIKALKLKGEIVAMTGDGVNDATSLVAADLGVAMGKIGTEVAKEAADIVLLDDNFGSIVVAVEEGRSIYMTIKKVILYLFSTSLGEVFTITGAILLGYPLPILPAQIIWLNFVTDGFLDVSLAMEPREKGLLGGKFEKPKKYLIDRLMAHRMVIMSLVMAIGALILFPRYFATDMTKAWTVSLTVLAAFQWFNAWNCRSEKKSIFQLNPFSNKFLVGSTIVVILLQLLAIYHPFMQRILHTTALGLNDWLLIIPMAASIMVVEEIRKAMTRRKVH